MKALGDPFAADETAFFAIAVFGREDQFDEAGDQEVNVGRPLARFEEDARLGETNGRGSRHQRCAAFSWESLEQQSKRWTGWPVLRLLRSRACPLQLLLFSRCSHPVSWLCGFSALGMLQVGVLLAVTLENPLLTGQYVTLAQRILARSFARSAL